MKGPFIGANDIENEGVFKWDHSGRNLDNTGYSNWYSFLSEPNNYMGGEDCVVVTAGFHNGDWFDLPCVGPRKALCEVNEA